MAKIKLHFQRFEFKYQFPKNIIEVLLPTLLKYMEWDPYVKDLPDKFYTVSSLYYDSVGLDCYYQKLAGDRTRKKLRIRFYDSQLKPQTLVFLEIKRKYDTVIVKDRLTFSYQDCLSLLKENKKLNLPLSKHDKDTLDEFIWTKIYNSMVPQNLVVYKRKPLISKVDPNFRVTIDYDLRTYLADWIDERKGGKLVRPAIAVMEVKFNNVLPFWFHQLIQRYNLEQQPFSKYCNSLEVCKPTLLGGSLSEIHQLELGLNLSQ